MKTPQEKKLEANIFSDDQSKPDEDSLVIEFSDGSTPVPRNAIFRRVKLHPRMAFRFKCDFEHRQITCTFETRPQG